MVQGIMELLFDAAYLITAMTVGIIMLKNGKTWYIKLFGIMSILLSAGDAFHLVPRVYALLTNGLAANAFALGLGKLITSITMTIFYVILYFIYELRSGEKNNIYRIIIGALAAIRIILCCFPQNDWFSANAPVLWGIIRNIPFSIMGILIIVLCFMQWKKHSDTDYLQMAIAVILSFAFYIPVVLWGDVVPLLGILMIPKTLAYVWVILIGFKHYLQEKKTAKKE